MARVRAWGGGQLIYPAPNGRGAGSGGGGPRWAGGFIGPGHRAEVAAQARSDARAGLARGRTACVPFRASVGCFQAVLVPAQRAWPIWTTIVAWSDRASNWFHEPDVSRKEKTKQIRAGSHVHR
jgi:hypothetical protein